MAGSPLPVPPPFSSLRAIAPALFAFFAAGLADGAMLPFFPLWAQDRAGVPVALIGVLFALYAGGELLAAPVIGGLADRISRRGVLAGATLGVGACFLALGPAHYLLLAATVLLGAGLFESVLHPTAAAVLADHAAPGRGQRSFALARMASGAGALLGPLAGAALFARHPDAVFLPGAATLLLAGLLALSMPRGVAATNGDAARDPDEDEEGIGALAPIFRHGWLARLLGATLLLELAGGWVEAVLPLWAHDRGALTPKAIGLLFAAAAALSVLAQWPLTRLAERMAPATAVVAAGTALAAGFVALLFGPVAAGALVALGAVTMARMLSGPLVNAEVGERAPAHRRASWLGAASVVQDLQDSLGPATGTALYALSAPLPWLAGIPLALAGTLGLHAALRRSCRPGGIDRTAPEAMP